MTDVTCKQEGGVWVRWIRRNSDGYSKTAGARQLRTFKLDPVIYRALIRYQCGGR